MRRRAALPARYGRSRRETNELYSLLVRRYHDKRRAGFPKQAAVYRDMAEQVGGEMPLTRTTRERAEELIQHGP